MILFSYFKHQKYCTKWWAGNESLEWMPTYFIFSLANFFALDCISNTQSWPRSYQHSNAQLCPSLRRIYIPHFDSSQHTTGAPFSKPKKLISLKFNSIFSLLSSEKRRRSFEYVLKSEHFQWGHSLPCSAYNEAAGRWTMINCTTCFMKFAPTITLLSHKLFYTPLFNSTTQLPGWRCLI